MDLEKKTRLLKKMLPQVAPLELLENPRSELESMGMTESTGLEAAERGLKKIKSAGMLESSEAAGLEAIIHEQFRPAQYVINDDYHQPSAPWEYLGEKKNKKRIKSAILSVGRIELPGDTFRKFGGTGFVVGPNLIMTNRHVAEIFASGLGQAGLSFKRSRRSAINFRREQLPSDIENLSVKQVVMIHPYWDMALLKVEGLSEERKPLKLSVMHPDELDGRDVVIIGYPAQDRRNDLALQNRIFGGVFDVKRLQPGYLRQRRKIRSFENQVNAITHDASTLGGNSGSAVIDVKTGEVVALHFAGLYLDANFAVSAYELARDSRVVDAGVHFSGQVETTSDWAGRWRIADQPDEGFTVPQSIAPPRPPQQPAQNSSVQVQGNSVTWTIPLNVTITFGTPQVVPAAGAAPPPASAEVEGLFGESAAETVARAYDGFSASALRGTNFSWNAALAAGAASNLAYQDNSGVEKVCLDKWRFDTCDFIHVNDTECFVASTANEVLLAFRGTAGIADWVRDLTVYSTDVEYGSVHEGFYLGMKQVKDEIVDVLERVNAKNKSFVLTGHSLGGALAAIAAAEFDGDYSVTSIYTYGQPAVGKEDFRTFMQLYASRFYRVVNDDDIVTKVPPGYAHVGKVYRFGFFGGVSHESVGAASPQDVETAMMTQTKFGALQSSVARGEVTDSDTPITEGIIPGISFLDHKMVKYLKKILKQLD